MILTALALLLASDHPADAERSGWRYRRPVAVRGNATLVSMALPVELSEKAGPGGRDLRLVGPDGSEIPYLLDWTSAREGLATWRAGISDLRRGPEGEGRRSPLTSQWTIDLGEPRTFTELSLDVPDVSFAWHVRVEASLDGKAYDLARGDAALFDQIWNQERVRQTEVRFESPVTARYLRITARSAPGSRLLEIEGASVTLRRRLRGDAWAREITVEPLPVSQGTTSRYRLEASSQLPFDEVELQADDSAFARRVRLVEQTQAGGRPPERLLGEGRVFRLRASDALVAGESLRLRTRSGDGGDLIVEIENGASPPLRGLRVRLHGSRMRLVFPVATTAGEGFALYYGNSSTRAPAYDLESLRPRITQALGTATADLGAEELNPRFRREPPLRFPATLGASVDARSWRSARPLSPILEEDVYTLTLSAKDLAAARPDLADLRLVNEADRQVPFLIERDFAEERLELSLRPGGPPSAGRSRFEMGPRGGWEAPGAVRLTRVEIEIADPFFERSARLLPSPTAGRREPPFNLTLARRPPSSEALVILSAEPLGPLVLEVDDGDNAPLELRSATAIVRVPRIVFKAAPGSLRLLLGNPGAPAPRYDLAGLRGELLAYSAVRAGALELGANPGSSDSLLSRFGRLPSSALVWGAIIAAMAVLLGLTLRTIKSA